jgi:PIN domain nuclease of toxin-antitoxin system
MPSGSMNSTPLLLDTCAVIWLFNRSPLSEASRSAIAAAATDRRLFVSPFSGWEIGMLVRKGKIALTMPPLRWFDKVVDHPAITLAMLTHDLLIESSFLPGEPPGDPADRIIVATARQMACSVVTRDRPILAYAGLGHVSALAC